MMQDRDAPAPGQIFEPTSDEEYMRDKPAGELEDIDLGEPGSVTEGEGNAEADPE